MELKLGGKNNTGKPMTSIQRVILLIPAHLHNLIENPVVVVNGFLTGKTKNYKKNK
jgi:hypothetical protein